MVLYDYPNMVLYFAGCYLLMRFSGNGSMRELFLSAFLFGLATYIRTETLVLVVMMMPVPARYFYKTREPMKKTVTGLGIFIGASVLWYIICMNVFVRNFVPFSFNTGEQIAMGTDRFAVFFERSRDIVTKLIFSPMGVNIYGYFIFVFCIVALSDVIFSRKYNREALFALYAIAVVFTGMSLLGSIIPLVDLMNTTKRGLFKALPLMLVYLANSPMLQRLSAFITDWEMAAAKTSESNEAKPADAGKKTRI